MAFTYFDSLTTDRDRVRFATSDTVSPGKVSDAEIAGLIAVGGTWQGAAALIWLRAAGDVARYGKDFTNVDGSVNESAFYEHCKVQADFWESKAAAASVTPSDLPLVIVGSLGPAPCDPNYRR